MSPRTVERADVLVVGAGPAGIGAARTLVDRGLATIVLEARDRICGRVHTDREFADVPVECGAEFIHGKDTTTYALARTFGLKLRGQRGREHVYLGERLSVANDQSCPETVLRELMRRVRAFLENGGPNINLVRFLDKKTSGYYEAPFGAFHATWRRLIKNLIASEMGGNLASMSLSGLLEHESTLGYSADNYRVSEGYGALFERLSEDLDIRLSSPADTIDWSRKRVRVTCGEKEFSAKRAVVALPLGVLKANDVRFLPHMPKDKAYAIEKFQIAPVSKIILRFREKHWQDMLAAIYTTHQTQVWWPGPNSEEPALISLVGGKAAERLSECSDEEVLRRSASHLSMMLGVPIDSAREGRVVHWHRERFTKMGYRFLPTGNVEHLRIALEAKHPVVEFAGDWIGGPTVHQAYDSGVEAGRRIADSLRSIVRKRRR